MRQPRQTGDDAKPPTMQASRIRQRFLARVGACSACSACRPKPPGSAPYEAWSGSVGWGMTTTTSGGSMNIEDGSKRPLRELLEGMGERHVREEFESGKWGASQDDTAVVSVWLRKQETKRREDRFEKEREQAAEAIEEARKANRISKEASRVAVAAFILAAVALALSLGLFIG